MNSNQACYNTESDFYSYSGSGNSGDENTCDNPDAWDDTGITGCTYDCSEMTTTTSTTTTSTSTTTTTTVSSSPVTVTRDLPSIIYPAGSFEVTLSLVKGDNSLTAFIIDDYVPVGWAVISSNPVYNDFDASGCGTKFLHLTHPKQIVPQDGAE